MKKLFSVLLKLKNFILKEKLLSLMLLMVFLVLTKALINNFVFSNLYFLKANEIYDPTYHKLKEGLKPAVVSLKRNDKNESPFCSAVIISSEYALTAGHCFDNYDVAKARFGQKIDFLKPKFLVLSDDGMVRTEAALIAYAYTSRIDIAVLKGDFTKFNYILADFYNVYEPKGLSGVLGGLLDDPQGAVGLSLCGFAQANVRYCFDGFLLGYELDRYVISSFSGNLRSGMSGGPVIFIMDTPELSQPVPVVIAINNAVGDIIGGGLNQMIFATALTGLDRVLFQYER